MKIIFIISALFCFNITFCQDKGFFDAQSHIQNFIKTKKAIAFIQKAIDLNPRNLPPYGVPTCRPWILQKSSLPEKILVYILNKRISKPSIYSKDLSSSSAASEVSSYCYTCCSRAKFPPAEQEPSVTDYLEASVSIKKERSYLVKKQARLVRRQDMSPITYD